MIETFLEFLTEQIAFATVTVGTIVTFSHVVTWQIDLPEEHVANVTNGATLAHVNVAGEEAACESPFLSPIKVFLTVEAA